MELFLDAMGILEPNALDNVVNMRILAGNEHRVVQ